MYILTTEGIHARLIRQHCEKLFLSPILWYGIFHPKGRLMRHFNWREAFSLFAEMYSGVHFFSMTRTLICIAVLYTSIRQEIRNSDIRCPVPRRISWIITKLKFHYFIGGKIHFTFFCMLYIGGGTFPHKRDFNFIFWTDLLTIHCRCFGQL